MCAKKKDWRLANEAFLKENSQRSEVVSLPSGLQYEILQSGENTTSKTTARSLVTVNYRGELINGNVFDDSFSRSYPEVFRVYEVIEGWQEALQLMKAGDRWKLYIPYALGYGTRRMDEIPGFSTLVFEVELIAVT